MHIRDIFFSAPSGLGKRIFQCVIVAGMGTALYFGGFAQQQAQQKEYEKQFATITEELTDTQRSEKEKYYKTYFDNHDINFDGHAVVVNIYFKDKTYGYSIDSYVDKTTKRARKTIVLFSTATLQQKGVWEVMIDGYDSDDPLLYEYVSTNKIVTTTEEIDGNTYETDNEVKDERCIRTHLDPSKDWISYFGIDNTKTWSDMKDKLTNIEFGENVTQGDDNHDLVHFAFNIHSMLAGEEAENKWMQGDLFIDTKTDQVSELLYGEGDTSYHVSDMGTYEMAAFEENEDACEVKDVDFDTAMAQYELDKKSFRLNLDRQETTKNGSNEED